MTDGPVPTQRVPDRDRSIDAARGLAILLIVFGHVLVGLVLAGIVSWDHPVRRTLPVIYLFHLTVFAFVAGIFVPRAVERNGVGPYLVTRLATFGWLYVLWSLVKGRSRWRPARSSTRRPGSPRCCPSGCLPVSCGSYPGSRSSPS